MSTSLMTNPASAPAAAQLSAAATLQSFVPELVALTLDAKQAHWNLTGPAFLPLHELTDAIAADLRTWTDRIAERAVALGTAVDARPATVAASTSDSFPAGWIIDREMVGELATRIGVLASRMTESLRDLEQSDAVGHDAAVETLEGLEKYRWMLLAHIR